MAITRVHELTVYLRGVRIVGRLLLRVAPGAKNSNSVDLKTLRSVFSSRSTALRQSLGSYAAPVQS